MATSKHLRNAQWAADGTSNSCQECGKGFTLVNRKHHCRRCGLLFCGICSNFSLLIPREQQLPGSSARGEALFVPQRCCKSCAAVLTPMQKDIQNLFGQSNKDIGIDRNNNDRYFSLPTFTNTMEQDIKQAVYTLYNFTADNAIEGRDRIPKVLLKKAKGIVFLTVVKAGFGVSGKYGSGVVIAKLDTVDEVTGSRWSAPSAVSITGVGFGMQVGGEIMDVILILRNSSAVRMFKTDTQVSLGGGLSVSVGPVGRAAATDIHASSKGATAVYSYAHCKGVFAGASLEASVMTSREDINIQFYGDSQATPKRILSGEIPPPVAAAVLYQAIDEVLGVEDPAVVARRLKRQRQRELYRLKQSRLEVCYGVRKSSVSSSKVVGNGTDPTASHHSSKRKSSIAHHFTKLFATESLTDNHLVSDTTVVPDSVTNYSLDQSTEQILEYPSVPVIPPLGFEVYTPSAPLDTWLLLHLRSKLAQKRAKRLAKWYTLQRNRHSAKHKPLPSKHHHDGVGGELSDIDESDEEGGVDDPGGGGDDQEDMYADEGALTCDWDIDGGSDEEGGSGGVRDSTMHSGKYTHSHSHDHMNSDTQLVDDEEDYGEITNTIHIDQLNGCSIEVIDDYMGEPHINHTSGSSGSLADTASNVSITAMNVPAAGNSEENGSRTVSPLQSSVITKKETEVDPRLSIVEGVPDLPHDSTRADMIAALNKRAHLSMAEVEKLLEKRDQGRMTLTSSGVLMENSSNDGSTAATNSTKGPKHDGFHGKRTCAPLKSVSIDGQTDHASMSTLSNTLSTAHVQQRKKRVSTITSTELKWLGQSKLSHDAHLSHSQTLTHSFYTNQSLSGLSGNTDTSQGTDHHELTTRNHALTKVVSTVPSHESAILLASIGIGSLEPASQVQTQKEKLLSSIFTPNVHKTESYAKWHYVNQLTGARGQLTRSPNIADSDSFKYAKSTREQLENEGYVFNNSTTSDSMGLMISSLDLTDLTAVYNTPGNPCIHRTIPRPLTYGEIPDDILEMYPELVVFVELLSVEQELGWGYGAYNTMNDHGGIVTATTVHDSESDTHHQHTDADTTSTSMNIVRDTSAVSVTAALNHEESSISVAIEDILEPMSVDNESISPTKRIRKRDIAKKAFKTVINTVQDSIGLSSNSSNSVGSSSNSGRNSTFTSSPVLGSPISKPEGKTDILYNGKLNQSPSHNSPVCCVNDAHYSSQLQPMVVCMDENNQWKQSSVYDCASVLEL